MSEENDALRLFFNVDSATKWEGIDGPGVSLPDRFKQYELKRELCIEFLQLSDTKNHVVFQLPFDQSHEVQINGENLKLEGARVSMDLSLNDEAMDKIDLKNASTTITPAF